MLQPTAGLVALLFACALFGCRDAAAPANFSAPEPHSEAQSALYADLMTACVAGDEATVRGIIEGAGADLVNTQTSQTKATPLARATEFGHLDVVEYLLSKGAQPNLSGKEGNVPLMQAAYKGNLEIVDALLRAGADPNVSESRYGDTPLIFAAWKDHQAVVEKLVSAGANVNFRSKQGRTAIQEAVQNQNAKMVKFLRDHGAVQP